MKFRSREFNVFSMSALDLFASALGAFILISFVLMPYFLRLDDEEVARMRMALEQTRASLQQTRASLQQTRANLEQVQASLEQERRALRECREREASCQAELESATQDAQRLQNCQANLSACEEKLSKTFLAIVIQWGTEQHDVDLHIIDPTGAEFFYSKKTIPGRPGELSADTTDGPGVEIWEVSEAPLGVYRVLYNLYSNRGNRAPAIVKGGVYHRDGHYRFGERRITREGRTNALLIAEVAVGNDGEVEISMR